ncbi:hypothetical protein D3M59_08970 [Sphingomonas edaphi]|uniref:Uncharacterized protein n=1 Tax=Sphingomonas edaphi TaxID=2315689 RepID=A0A418Q0D1_9SPHN|nr:hypothetical protein D3M59_08970 [Sphingomonas edaphi]
MLLCQANLTQKPDGESRAEGEPDNCCSRTGNGAGGEGIRDAEMTLAGQCGEQLLRGLALDRVADYYRIR